MTGRTKQRGYGGRWKPLRDSWDRRIRSGEPVRCRRGAACKFAEMLPDGSIGGGLIVAGDEWDLGHDDRDRSLPPHPEHRACNRATTGRGGSRKRPQEPHPGMI